MESKKVASVRGGLGAAMTVLAVAGLTPPTAQRQREERLEELIRAEGVEGMTLARFEELRQLSSMPTERELEEALLGRRQLHELGELIEQRAYKQTPEESRAKMAQAIDKRQRKAAKRKALAERQGG